MRRKPENDTKIIFLDFDGVITTFESNYKLDPGKMRLVERIVKETGAKIVITSSWRRGTIEETKKHITDTTDYFVSVNPFFPIDAVLDQTKKLVCHDSEDNFVSVPRGVEIQEWIIRNDIWSYVILDDVPDILLSQRKHLVLTDEDWGLGEKNVEEAIKILKEPW